MQINPPYLSRAYKILRLALILLVLSLIGTTLSINNLTAGRAVQGSSNASDSCITIQTGILQDSDAYVTASKPDSNSNSDNGGIKTDITTSWWTYNGTPLEVRALLKFVLPYIPYGSIIANASLSLYAGDSDLYNGISGSPMYGSANACYLKRVTSPWAAFGVTWNNQPSATDSAEVLLPQSTSPTENYLNLDVTQFVSTWVHDSTTNNGLMIEMIGTSVYNSMIFCSSNFPDSTQRPKLEICYMACNTVAGFTFLYNANGEALFTNTSTTTGGQVLNWVFYNANGAIGNSNAANPWFIFSGPPPYSATLFVSDSLYPSCKDSIQQQIVTTTIAPLTLNNSLRIIPNPANKYAYIEVGAQGNYQFNLLSQTSQLIATKQTRQVDIFDTEHLAAGIYYISVLDRKTNTEVAGRKLVVVH